MKLANGLSDLSCHFWSPSTSVSDLACAFYCQARSCLPIWTGSACSFSGMAIWHGVLALVTRQALNVGSMSRVPRNPCNGSGSCLRAVNAPTSASLPIGRASSRDGYTARLTSMLRSFVLARLMLCYQVAQAQVRIALTVFALLVCPVLATLLQMTNYRFLTSYMYRLLQAPFSCQHSHIWPFKILKASICYRLLPEQGTMNLPHLH